MTLILSYLVSSRPKQKATLPQQVLAISPLLSSARINTEEAFEVRGLLKEALGYGHPSVRYHLTPIVAIFWVQFYVMMEKCPLSSL